MITSVAMMMTQDSEKYSRQNQKNNPAKFGKNTLKILVAGGKITFSNHAKSQVTKIVMNPGSQLYKGTHLGCSLMELHSLKKELKIG